MRSCIDENIPVDLELLPRTILKNDMWIINWFGLLRYIGNLLLDNFVWWLIPINGGYGEKGTSSTTSTPIPHIPRPTIIKGKLNIPVMKK